MKVGKRLPATEGPTPAQAEAIRVRRDAVVADLVRKAESAEVAWEAFGEDRPLSNAERVAERSRAARAEDLLKAVHAIGVQVKSGRGHVEALNGEPVPEEWVE